MSHTAFIAIGSNLGNPAEQCHRALCKLENTEGINLVRCSSFYPTDPLVPEGVDRSTVPSYVNVVCEIETTLAPELLLERILAVAQEMGRERREKWESRLIDLDLLFYDDLVFQSKSLKLPHPEIQNRWFVLQPLCEIAPEWIHPVLKQTIAEMIYRLSAYERVTPAGGSRTSRSPPRSIGGRGRVREDPRAAGPIHPKI